MRKKVNKCVLPTGEEDEHFKFSVNCKCKPIVVEYSTSILYVHRELHEIVEDDRTAYRRHYLRKV